jgi:origin recognition complex subunit 5
LSRLDNGVVPDVLAQVLDLRTRADDQIPEFETQGLLKRVSPPDRLDNVMLRCEADYEVAKDLARELKIVLDEYIYEGMQ